MSRQGYRSLSTTSTIQSEGAGVVKRKRRNYGDVLIVCLAGGLASAALNRRYQLEERSEELQQALARYEYEAEVAGRQVELVKGGLKEGWSDGVQSARAGGVEGFNRWVERRVDETLAQTTRTSTSSSGTSSNEVGVGNGEKSQPKII